MDWMDHNLDAYRDVAEILTTLRRTVRRQLEGAFGRDWHRDGLPAQVMERMIERKEREKAIDWHESEYQEIINYSSFADMLEIVTSNAELFTEIVQLAPSTALLHTRFLELDVISQKIAMARPISENELGFLGTFHIRFRKAVDALKSRPVPDPLPRQQEVTAPEEPTASLENAKADRASAAGEPAVENDALAEETLVAEAPAEPPMTAPIEINAEASEATQPEPELPEPEQLEVSSEPTASEPVEPVASPLAATAEPPPAPAEQPPAAAATSRRPRPPMRPATRVGGAPAATAQAAAAQQTAAAAAPAVGGGNGNGRDLSEVDAAQGPENRLESALERSDSAAILRELYREVTSIAEGIWTSDEVPVAMVWPKVVGSSWYEVNFSKLGLKPLSDFYDVRKKTEERVQSGASKNELQEFLKECNFAQTLLAMRDMFQKHRI